MYYGHIHVLIINYILFIIKCRIYFFFVVRFGLLFYKLLIVFKFVENFLDGSQNSYCGWGKKKFHDSTTLIQYDTKGIKRVKAKKKLNERVSIVPHAQRVFFLFFCFCFWFFLSFFVYFVLFFCMHKLRISVRFTASASAFASAIPWA